MHVRGHYLNSFQNRTIKKPPKLMTLLLLGKGLERIHVILNTTTNFEGELLNESKGMGVGLSSTCKHVN